MAPMSSQIGMFRRDGDPSTITRSYVPILLAKRGERVALERIAGPTRDGITPLIRVVPPELRRHDEDDPPPAEIARLAKAMGDRVTYLDAVGSPRRKHRMAPLGASYMRQIYETAMASSLAFAPVYPFGRPDLGELVRTFASDAIGAAVLVSRDAALTWGSQHLDRELREEVRSLDVDPGRLDVVAGLGYIPAGADDVTTTAWFVRQIAAAAPWRSLILAGTSIPDSVADEIPNDGLDGIERRERALFDAVQDEVGVTLRFGDYAVQHPVPPTPAPVPKMRASIRYTAGDFTYVSRGGRALGELDRDEVPSEYREIASRLRVHPPFVGAGCCWGDAFVEELSDGRTLARGQHWMRAMATCHHLTVVARERANPVQGQRSRPRHRGMTAGQRIKVRS
jgi:hypothetical protein